MEHQKDFQNSYKKYRNIPIHQSLICQTSVWLTQNQNFLSIQGFLLRDVHLHHDVHLHRDVHLHHDVHLHRDVHPRYELLHHLECHNYQTENLISQAYIKTT